MSAIRWTTSHHRRSNVIAALTATKFDKIVAIGASAGGLDPMMQILGRLPSDFPAPVLVAVHGGEESRLKEVLAFRSLMPVVRAEDGDLLKPGQAFVCPGAHHMYVKDDRVRVTHAPRGTTFRPSIDTLFQSIATEYGERGIAVVLSGQMNDGTVGAQILYDEGALTLVQCPEEAEAGSMPSSVIRLDHPGNVLEARKIADRLVELVGH